MKQIYFLLISILLISCSKVNDINTIAHSSADTCGCEIREYSNGIKILEGQNTYNQLIINISTIQFDSVDFDSMSAWNVDDGLFTTPKSGWYKFRFNFDVNWHKNTYDSRFFAKISNAHYLCFSEDTIYYPLMPDNNIFETKYCWIDSGSIVYFQDRGSSYEYEILKGSSFNVYIKQ